MVPAQVKPCSVRRWRSVTVWSVSVPGTCCAASCSRTATGDASSENCSRRDDNFLRCEPSIQPWQDPIGMSCTTGYAAHLSVWHVAHQGLQAHLLSYDSVELPSNKDIMIYFCEPGIWLRICLHMKYTLALITNLHLRNPPTTIIIVSSQKKKSSSIFVQDVEPWIHPKMDLGPWLHLVLAFCFPNFLTSYRLRKFGRISWIINEHLRLR